MDWHRLSWLIRRSRQDANQSYTQARARGTGLCSYMSFLRSETSDVQSQRTVERRRRRQIPVRRRRHSQAILNIVFDDSIDSWLTWLKYSRFSFCELCTFQIDAPDPSILHHFEQLRTQKRSGVVPTIPVGSIFNFIIILWSSIKICLQWQNVYSFDSIFVARFQYQVDSIGAEKPTASPRIENDDVSFQ